MMIGGQDMRVKFGSRIKLCKVATHSENSSLLILTTNDNEVYTVDMLTPENAEKNFNKLLQFGYLDVSEYEYSNW